MNVAGQLDVLSPEQMQTIHEKACEILSKKGVVFESDETIEILALREDVWVSSR